MSASALHITVQWAGRTVEVLSWFPRKNRHSEFKFPIRYRQFAKGIRLRSHPNGTIELLDTSSAPAQARKLTGEASIVIPQPNGSSAYRCPSLPLAMRFEVGPAPAGFLKYQLSVPKHALAVSILFHIVLGFCVVIPVPSLNPEAELPDLPDRAFRPMVSTYPPQTHPAFVPIRAVQSAETTQPDFNACPQREANCTNLDSTLGTGTNQAWQLTWAAKQGSVNRLGLAVNGSLNNEGTLALTAFASPHLVKKGESLQRLAQKHRISPISCIFNNTVNPELLSKRRSPRAVRAGDLVYLPKFCVGEVAIGIVFRSFEWDLEY